MNWKLRGILALVLVLSLTAGLFLPAAAEDQRGWLVIKLGDHDVINDYLKDGNTVEMSIYQIAKSNGKGGWEVNNPFIGFAQDIKTAEMRLRIGNDEMIQTLLNDSQFRDLTLKATAYQTVPLNDEYEFLFTSLDSGIYYAIMTKGPEGLLVQSPLVPIPYRPSGTGSELFSLTVGAKVLEYFPLTAIKRMAGRDFYPGDKFTFELTASAGAPLPKDAAGNDVTKVTIQPTGGREAMVDFGKLVFTQANASKEGKTYTYTIVEKDEGEKTFEDQNITPEASAKQVTVEVKDDGNGKLTVTGIDQKNPPVLTNSYDYKTWIPLTAFKELQGREFREGDSWTFGVRPNENEKGAPKLLDSQDLSVAKNALAKTIKPTAGSLEQVDLGYLHFDENDIGKTYHYTIFESGSVKGVTNDTSKKVEVKVSYNPDTNEMEVVSSSGDQTDNAAKLSEKEMLAKTETVTFKNRYEASSRVTFRGKKTVENLDLIGRVLEPNVFLFEIQEIASDNKVLQTLYAYNDAEGNIRYPSITFTLDDVGVHTYKIRELNETLSELINETVDDSLAGIIGFDETVHTVKLTVTDKKDGTLKVAASSNATYKNPYELNFTNKVLTGNLRINKKVESPTSETGEFPFTVEMSREGKPVNATFGDVTFTNGIATFSLKQNEYKLIPGIPLGTVYTVKEVMAEEQRKLYEVSEIKQQLVTASGKEDTGTVEQPDALASGTIVSGTIVADYTNKRNTGDLTIVKKLAEDNLIAEDLDKEFTFTVTMADPNVVISGANVVFVTEDENGAAMEKPYTAADFDAESNYKASVTIRTKADAPVKIKGLPVGVQYTITEKEAPFFSLREEGTVNAAGIIPQSGITATLTNERSVKPVSLKVTKTVEGAANDTTDFAFTVTLSEWNGMKLTGKFGDMDFADGVAAFKLKSGEAMTATGLPSGISYTVTEADTTNYVMTNATGASGTIDADGPLGADRVASFTNVYVPTPTGGNHSGGGNPGVRTTPTVTPKVTESPEPTPMPDDARITVEGSKTWEDNDNAAGRRPASITIRLIADSSAMVEEVASRTVTEEDGWSWSFTDLPAMDSYNLPIVYSIVEDPAAGYTATYSGYDIINTMRTELTSATVIKQWDDDDDPDHLMRPAAVRATLYGNGKAVADVILKESNGWTATVDELPVYQDGGRVAYTWSEEEVLGYVQTGNSTDGTVTTITNTLWKVPEDETEHYETNLNLGIIINHVGDCFD